MHKTLTVDALRQRRYRNRGSRSRLPSDRGTVAIPANRLTRQMSVLIREDEQKKSVWSDYQELTMAGVAMV